MTNKNMPARKFMIACLMIIYLITNVELQVSCPSTACLCTDGGCHSSESYCCSNAFKSPAVTCSGCPFAGAPGYCCAAPAPGAASVIYFIILIYFLIQVN